MKFFFLLMPVLLLVQKTNTCNKNMHAATSVPTSATTKIKGNANIDSAIQQILLYTNLERQKAKVPVLTLSNKLMTAAANYAALMAKEGEMSHTVNGQTIPMRYAAIGYTWKFCGENVAAYTLLSGQQVVQDMWMHSTGHRANILNKNYTEIGIGVAYSPSLNVYYYCQDFGQPRP